MKNVPDGIEVLLLDLVLAEHAVYDDEAAISVISNQSIRINIDLLQYFLSILKLQVRTRILQNSKVLLPIALVLYLVVEYWFDTLFF